jgi:DNA-binding response OmpR family regulator
MKILVVEDEEKISGFIKEVLETESNKVIVCKSLDEVMAHHYYKMVDLIILDLMLEGRGNGLELVKYLKKEKIQLPVIVLTALQQISTKIDLLNAGADDYLTKPFDAGELLARIKSVYRRYLDAHIDDKVDIADLVFQRRENVAVRGGKKILLTPKEGELLMFLTQNVGKVVRNEDILKKVWDTRMGFHSNIVQATIRRLRKKIDEGHEKKLIRNVHGIGYTLEV